MSLESNDVSEIVGKKYNIPRENIFRHPQVAAKMVTEAQSVEVEIPK